eukprot:284819494_2
MQQASLERHAPVKMTCVSCVSCFQINSTYQNNAANPYGKIVRQRRQTANISRELRVTAVSAVVNSYYTPASWPRYPLPTSYYNFFALNNALHSCSWSVYGSRPDRQFGTRFTAWNALKSFSVYAMNERFHKSKDTVSALMELSELPGHFTGAADSIFLASAARRCVSFSTLAAMEWTRSHRRNRSRMSTKCQVERSMASFSQRKFHSFLSNTSTLAETTVKEGEKEEGGTVNSTLPSAFLLPSPQDSGSDPCHSELEKHLSVAHLPDGCGHEAFYNLEYEKPPPHPSLLAETFALDGACPVPFRLLANLQAEGVGGLTLQHPVEQGEEELLQLELCFHRCPIDVNELEASRQSQHATAELTLAQFAYHPARHAVVATEFVCRKSCALKLKPVLFWAPTVLAAEQQRLLQQELLRNCNGTRLIAHCPVTVESRRWRGILTLIALMDLGLVAHPP